MQVSRWSWLPLIACAAATGTAAQTPQASGAANQGPEPERESGWVLPPVRSTGSVAYDFRAARAGETQSSSHLVTGNLKAQTFIYAPWLATVTGDVGASSNWSRQDSTHSIFQSESLEERIRTRDQFLTGSLRANVFPQSKFPFEAHYTRADSRNDSGLGTVLAFRTQNLGFSQQYQPVDGAYRLFGRYDHHEQNALGLRSKQDVLNADVATGWKNNIVGASFSHSRARDSGTDNDSRFDSVVVHHDYTPPGTLSLNSSANWTRARELAAAAPADVQVSQLNSVGIWRYDPKLSLTGSARATFLRDDTSGTALDTFGATVGTSYELTPKLRLQGSAGLTATRANDSDATSFTGGANASYQGDTYQFAGATYQWFASGGGGLGLGTRAGAETDRHTDLSLQLGHSITRPVTVVGEAIALSATQSLGWSRGWSNADELGGGTLGSSRSLLTSVSATWQKSGSDTSLYVRSMYSDARSMDQTDQRHQMFNFQLTGALRLDNRRSFSGDLTYQETWQRSGSPPGVFAVNTGPTNQSSVGGEITYRHENLLGIPRLQFSSRVRLAQEMQRQTGSLLSLPDRETRLWEGRLTWSVGRLDTDLNLRVSRIDGHTVQSVMFRIQRSFGL